MLEINKIYLMDCMEGMKEFPDKYFELAIVDPPYGIGIDKWDVKPNQDYFNELFRVTKNQIIWGGNYFNLDFTQGWICWDKTFNETIRGKSLSKSQIKKENISEFELAWTSFLKKARFVRYMNLGNLQGFEQNIKVDYSKPPKIHITEKPIKLYEWLLKNYAKQGDKILDTHVGSGSSIIAFEKHGFDYCGFEIDKDYYEASTKRILKHRELLQQEKIAYD